MGVAIEDPEEAELVPAVHTVGVLHRLTGAHQRFKRGWIGWGAEGPLVVSRIQHGRCVHPADPEVT